jgi:methyl-accepting chemotaxis protein
MHPTITRAPADSGQKTSPTRQASRRNAKIKAIRDVTLVAPQELPSVIEHIRSLGAMYEENDKSLSALYAARTDITAQEREIYGRVNANRARSSPLIDHVIALQRVGDYQGARTVVIDQTHGPG